MKYVLTGQPPGRPGRVALGPLLAMDAECMRSTLVRRGWSEVWMVLLDEKLLATLLAGADGAGEAE